MQVRIGTCDMELGEGGIGQLRDANDLLGNAGALNARMEEDGYLLIRGLHDVDKVRATRQLLTDNLMQNGVLDERYPAMDAVIKEGARGSFLGGSKELTRNQAFLDLVEASEVMGFFADFLQADVLTYDYKWLRLVGNGDFTGAHYDICYMGRGTQEVYTCWTPLGDIPYEMGPLSLLVGSHRAPEFEEVRNTYGKMDVDRDKITGAFSNDPLEMVERFGGKWQTTEFQMGDALIFGMYTMHGSLTNVSNRFRLSTDTRYQRSSEPVDERWIGDNPIAHYAWLKGETYSMEQAREAWKV
jgi:hypothetical protein